ncbi:dihydrofolate reductase family protein [Pseudonocardia yunnanensis]|uniref:Dihydrofolate reductase family protein n=1 Tax=Pseudonocardia yunnanensis TaxID=58107 RepID=A0ABW4F384_9PSEU
MRLTLTGYLSLDGVSQSPGSPDEDSSDGFTRGGWLMPYLDEDFFQVAGAWFDEADACLFGARTYAGFSSFWPLSDPDDPFAGKMNSLPKYVASQSLRQADWAHTTILSGDVVAQVAELKRQPGRELQIHGSALLAQSLLGAGLIDTIRLMVAPLVVGSGRRLFPEGTARTGLRLISNGTTAAGLTVHTYESAELPDYGTYRTEE